MENEKSGLKTQSADREIKGYPPNSSTIKYGKAWTGMIIIISQIISYATVRNPIDRLSCN